MAFRLEEDRWTAQGRSILSAERLEAIRRCLENSPIIVEHWYYRAGRSPVRMIFDDMENFEHYLSEQARPGDAFHVWEFSSLCRDENALTDGKFPDDDGCVPERGAY
jgi:hypothetical protein